MREALFYERLGDWSVQCHLCAHECVIKKDGLGLCGVRQNREGVLYSLVYGKVVARHVDPIEKKPLFHFYPGSKSYSVATVGCNFRCLHCQNSDISQYPKAFSAIPGDDMSAEDVVSAAQRASCASISYTYTEPTIFMEFALDCARLARERGIRNVFVSNGFTSPEAIRAIAPYLDGNNIDLKGDDPFYRKVVGGRLQPVLDSIRLMKDSGVWVEVTTLVIPGYNDSDDFLKWAADFICSVDPGMPWHVTQFYPTFRLTDRGRTPLDTLRRARDIGIGAGLKFVYEGNVPGQGRENTYCPSCGELLIERYGFFLNTMYIKDSRCVRCGNVIEGVGLP